MSMKSVFVYGYGFNIECDDATFIDFINNHRETLKTLDHGSEILESIDSGISEKEAFANFECQNSGMCSAYSVISNVMSKENDIHFECHWECANGNDKEAILFPECLPWQLTPKEKDLTQEDLHEIIQKYTDELKIDSSKIDYIEVEYFG